MNLTYIVCKKVIENRTYGTKEDFQAKLDVFLLGNRISTDEYNELISLLESI